MITEKKRSEESAWGQEGERNLETWYKQTVTKLYRFVYSKLQNNEETEDITQETFARCLKTLNYQEELPPYSYLKETARNLMYDRFRRMRILPMMQLTQDISDKTRGEEDVATTVHMQNLLNLLPDDQRTVLQLRIIEGYSRRETAERM